MIIDHHDQGFKCVVGVDVYDHVEGSSHLVFKPEHAKDCTERGEEETLNFKSG